jgi:YfiH family protein
VTPTSEVLTETAELRGGVTHYVVAPWEMGFGVRAGIVGGPGTGDFSLTPIAPGDQLEHLRSSLGFNRLVLARQVHGTRIRRHDREARPGTEVLEGFDGHVTREEGVLLAVTIADCVPVFLAHPASGTLALVHAGWRGVASGMLESGVGAVAKVAGVSPRDIVMHCSVSICGGCYEVGPEVVQAVEGRRSAEPEHVDLRQALCRQAIKLGMTRVTASPLCTSHSEENFYSHRASGGTAGRMVAYLGRPAA